jgi:hypothetical protein
MKQLDSAKFVANHWNLMRNKSLNMRAPTAENLSGSGVGRRAARGGTLRGDHEGGQVQGSMRSSPTGGNLRDHEGDQVQRSMCNKTSHRRHVGTTMVARYNSSCAIRA